MTSTYLFIGDSITDAGRFDDEDRHLGDGYVRRLDEAFAASGRDVRVINTGIGGHRADHLRARWAEDATAHNPELLSILIGVNDMWRRYDSDDPTTTEAFEENYRAMLGGIDRSTTRTVVMIEPFLLPVNDEQRAWREDLDPKIEVVRRLAAESGAILVPADVHLTALAAESSPEQVAFDGVHPTDAGHRALADLWVRTVLG